MTMKEKGWVWKLTWPFAHANFTTLGDTLYHPRGRTPSLRTVAHEEIHSRQQRETGIVKFVFLYLFVLPFLWNPFRWKWEWEAYEVGSKWSAETIRKTLRSRAYGWLLGVIAVIFLHCTPKGVPVSVIEGIELAGSLNQENTLKLLSETDILMEDACNGMDGCFDCMRTVWIKPNAEWKMCVAASHEILHRLSIAHFGDCDFDHIRFIYDAAQGDCEREFR